MRKLFILLLCLIPAIVFADVDTFDGQTGIDTWDGQTGIGKVVGQTVASGASCSVDNHSAIVDTSGTASDNNQSGTGGQQVVLSSATTITQYKINICDQSSAAETFTVRLYEDNGSNEIDFTSEVVGSAVTLDKSDVADCGTPSLHTFTLGTPLAGVSAGTYWVVANSNSDAAWIQVGLYLGNLSPDGTIYYGGSTYSDSYAVPVAVMGCAE